MAHKVAGTGFQVKGSLGDSQDDVQVHGQHHRERGALARVKALLFEGGSVHELTYRLVGTRGELAICFQHALSPPRSTPAGATRDRPGDKRGALEGTTSPGLRPWAPPPASSGRRRFPWTT